MVESLRQLIYIPVVHTEADMGSLASGMKKTYISRFGRTKYTAHVKAIDDMWDGLKKRIEKLGFDYSHTKVYQDGLPNCGFELKIIEDLAKRGSPNHELVLWIVKKGATLVGTENPELLVKEYNHIKKILSEKDNDKRKKLIKVFEKDGRELIKARDAYIAKRIDETLKPGEAGFLFIGMLHRVDEKLNGDIKTSYLIHRLPFKRSFEMELIGNE